MITLSKPAGIPVFPPHAEPSGDCVLARLLATDPARGDVSWPPGFEGGIAHRLDVSTSGALLVADDPEELARIREAFAARALRKTYRFLAARDVPWDENTCEADLAHHRRRKDRMVVRRGAATPHRGRWYPAHTSFRRIHGNLWRAVITTGVMHQVRAHAAFVGLSLRGDRRYGGGPSAPDAPAGVEFFLHHEGLIGAGIRTEAVPLPAWAR